MTATLTLQMKKLMLKEKSTVALTRGRVWRTGRTGNTGWKRGGVNSQLWSREGTMVRRGCTKDRLLH